MNITIFLDFLTRPVSVRRAFLYSGALLTLVAFACQPQISEEEVLGVMEASLRSMQSSMNKENLKLHERYDNAADMSFINDDHSLLHTLKVNRERGRFQIAGECLFADYRDEALVYPMNGKLTYRLNVPQGFKAAGSYGMVEGKLNPQGGRIKEVEYEFQINEKGQFVTFDVKANGRPMDMKQYQGVLNLMQFVAPFK